MRFKRSSKSLTLLCRRIKFCSINLLSRHVSTIFLPKIDSVWDVAACEGAGTSRGRARRFYCLVNSQGRGNSVASKCFCVRFAGARISDATSSERLWCRPESFRNRRPRRFVTFAVVAALSEEREAPAHFCSIFIFIPA